MVIPSAFKEVISRAAPQRIKNGKKDFFRNANKYPIYNGDAVVVDVPNGHHLGHIALQGELVRLQMIKIKVENDENIRSIYGVATEKDLEKFEEVKKQFEHASKTIVSQTKLQLNDLSNQQSDRFKEIVDEHHGDVKVESTPGAGTTVRVFLPVFQ